MPCSEDDDSQTGFSEPSQGGMSKAELRKVNKLFRILVESQSGKTNEERKNSIVKLSCGIANKF